MSEENELPEPAGRYVTQLIDYHPDGVAGDEPIDDREYTGPHYRRVWVEDGEEVKKVVSISEVESGWHG